MPEQFSQARMDRCGRIHIAIMQNWATTKRLAYVVRATAPVAGMSLDELRQQYFSIGIGDDLTDIPFTDLLVVLSMIRQTMAQLKANPNQREGKMRFSITTDFPDEEAARLLSEIQIETPFDTSKFLKLEAD